VLDHKPWIAEEGESWLAAFPCSTDPAALRQAELTVAPDVTVPLPPPSLARGGRRRSSGSRRPRDPKAGDAGKSNGRSKDDGGTHHSQLQGQRDAALRSRDEALLELDAVQRDRDRLRLELGEALAAREAVIAERHDAIDAEVRLRIADLRAETERERAAAGRAAQFARERDGARAERAEALGERDEAHAERDAAWLERNRMLAQRDTARSRAEEAMRRWEATAALGTRRTQERDAAASERDRVVRERDAALERSDRVTGERDAAEQERDRVAGERDAALKLCDRVTDEREAAEGERDRVARERDSVLEERDRVVGERDAALEQREEARKGIRVAEARATTQLDLEDPPAFKDEVGVAGAEPTERKPAPAGTGSTGLASSGSAQPPTTVSPASDAARRPPCPPAPPETRPRHAAVRAMESGPSTPPGIRPGGSPPEVVGPRDDTGMWRARLLAIAALLVVFVVFVVILTAK
jgi:hypothetical protein